MPLRVESMGYAGARDDPDAVVQGTYDGYMVEFWNLAKSRADVIWQLKDSEQYLHARDGFFAMWGDHVRRGYDAGTKNIQDMTPTFLYIMGVPIGPDMDGVVMADVLRSDFVSDRPQLVNAGYGDIPRIVARPEKDLESLERTLKSFGYIQ